MRKWLQEHYIYYIFGIMVLCTLIALSFAFFPELRPYWPEFLPGFAATILGVVMGASLTLLQMEGQRRELHAKFLLDVFNELNRMPELLTGRGNFLDTDIWDSGISSGSILGIDSNELGELSSLYQQIENNVYEAKICRQAGEFPKRLPKGTHQEYAQKHWSGLSDVMRRREERLRKRIETYLKKDFWDKTRARGHHALN